METYVYLISKNLCVYNLVSKSVDSTTIFYPVTLKQICHEFDRFGD